MKIFRIPAMIFAALATAACGTVEQPDPGTGRPAQTAKRVVDDQAVVARIQSALAADPEISPYKINVISARGQVTLTGDIKSMSLRKKVESIVRSIDGVWSVDNQLVITG